VAKRGSGLEPELLVQRTLRVAQGVERIGLTPAPVERKDLLSAQTLTEWMHTHEPGELGHELRLSSSLEIRIDATLQCGEAELFQRRPLAFGERSIDVGERRPAEQPVRVAEQTRPLAEIGSGSRFRDARAEDIEVELAFLDAHEIARCFRHEAVAEHLPQPRNLVLE